MPQLEFSTYITQIFWTFLIFIMLWIIMDKVVIPRVSEMVEARKRKYNDFILKAEEINQKALASLKQYEEEITAAKEKATKQIKQKEEELKEFIQTKEREYNLQLEEKITEAKVSLEEDRKKALSNVERDAKIIAQTILNEINLGNDVLNKKKAS